MLSKLKVLLEIPKDDASLDEKLNIIIDGVTARLKLLLGGVEPTKELDHIILEASVARFNRIGSEGMSSHSVEGESTAYIDDDFAGFMDEIQSFLESQKDSKRGKVRFI